MRYLRRIVVAGRMAELPPRVVMLAVAFAPLELLSHGADVFLALATDQIPGVLPSLGREQQRSHYSGQCASD
jgi:hypothetical protein